MKEGVSKGAWTLGALTRHTALRGCPHRPPQIGPALSPPARGAHVHPRPGHHTAGTAPPSPVTHQHRGPDSAPEERTHLCFHKACGSPSNTASVSVARFQTYPSLSIVSRPCVKDGGTRTPSGLLHLSLDLLLDHICTRFTSKGAVISQQKILPLFLTQLQASPFFKPTFPRTGYNVASKKLRNLEYVNLCSLPHTQVQVKYK